VPDEDALSSLMDMGLATRKKAIKALKCTQNNVERAVDWIFSHPDDDGDDDGESEGAAATPPAPSSSKRLTNGSPKYSLMAFISHMGTSTMCGHYVCHIKRDGRWVIFNDSKVALSEKPPKGLGYLYIYKRSTL
jgi:ubiquitin carboxyl-terminal hydrolase 5/13